MHHNTLNCRRPLRGSIPGTTITVTILTALLSCVSREAQSPWTHPNLLQMAPVAVRYDSQRKLA